MTSDVSDVNVRALRSLEMSQITHQVTRRHIKFFSAISQEFAIYVISWWTTELKGTRTPTLSGCVVDDENRAPYFINSTVLGFATCLTLRIIEWAKPHCAWILPKAMLNPRTYCDFQTGAYISRHGEGMYSNTTTHSCLTIYPLPFSQTQQGWHNSKFLDMFKFSNFVLTIIIFRFNN